MNDLELGEQVKQEKKTENNNSDKDFLQIVEKEFPENKDSLAMRSF